ncbi:hypothetical protein B0H19DRAFT_888570, partial [Mycena capillaripes]
EELVEQRMRREEDAEALSTSWEEKMKDERDMFFIVAARMFEERVFYAHAERVVQERQLQLVRE